MFNDASRVPSRCIVEDTMRYMECIDQHPPSMRGAAARAEGGGGLLVIDLLLCLISQFKGQRMRIMRLLVVIYALFPAHA